jgi:hypothetical protein
MRARYEAAPTAETIMSLADAFDVSVQTIRNIVRYRTWRHLKQKRRA